jgi:HAMP domain-containing protein/HPt (histidine-containing phosphotransfer) domain-containing protein
MRFEGLEMRNAIWKKILFFVVLPFLVIFVILSFVIIQSAVSEKRGQIEFDLRNLARFNEANFLGLVNSVRISITTAAAALEKIDYNAPDARKRGEDILLSMFENRYVYNIWFAFEPMAFDGRDAFHTDEYPGAPSGRYMRSFLREGNGYVVAPDMDESSIDDPERSVWYTRPKALGKPCIDLSENVMYDYRTGEGARNVAALSVPIYRNGEIIGCVGADILFNQMILGQEIYPEATSALFSLNFSIIHARNSAYVGEKIDRLGFHAQDAIKGAFREERDLFLPNEYSFILGDEAFTFFKPMFLEGFDELVYAYAALPRNAVLKSMYTVLVPIVTSLIAAFFAFFALLYYLWRAISKPINALTLAADAISRGDLNMEITASSSNDEIGVMSRSLRRMVEQFRVYMIMVERLNDRLNLYKAISEAVYRQENLRDAFDAIVHDICTYCSVYKASLVFLTEGRPKILSRYELNMGFSSDYGDNIPDFPFHGQVASMIAGRKILFLNKHAMVEQKIDFTDWATASACLLPIYIRGELRGYFILEKKHSTAASSNDDESLIFISETISYILTQKEAHGEGLDRMLPNDIRPEIGLPEPQTSDFLPPAADSPPSDKIADLPIVAGARNIAGLDVDRGVSLVGGSQEHYADLLRVSVKVFGATVDRLKGFLPDDLRNFAIEVHGIKGALFNIGAGKLGDFAQELETSAREGKTELCQDRFADFERELVAFRGELTAILSAEETPRAIGSLAYLRDELERAKAYCENYDSFSALNIMNSLARMRYEGETIELTENLRGIAETLEELEYEDAIAGISRLLASLETSRP